MSSNVRFTTILFLLCLLLAFGCAGGGSGGSGGTTPDGGEYPEAILPKVVALPISLDSPLLAPGSPVQVRFSRPMDPASFTAANVRLVKVDDVSGAPPAFSLSGDGLVLTVTPVEGKPLTTYALKLYAQSSWDSIDRATLPKDTLGRALTGEARFLFTTGPADASPRVLQHKRPRNLEAEVPPDAKVTVFFTAPMGEEGLASGFTLESGGVPVPGTVALKTGGRCATFTPSSPLAPDTWYTARVKAGTPGAEGAPLANGLVWSFKTAPKVWPFRTWEKSRLIHYLGYLETREYSSEGVLLTASIDDDGDGLPNEVRDYDQNGRLSTVRYSRREDGTFAGLVIYQRDGEGRVTREKCTFDGADVYDYREEFDGFGRRASRESITPWENWRKTYSYSEDGVRKTTATDLLRDGSVDSVTTSIELKEGDEDDVILLTLLDGDKDGVFESFTTGQNYLETDEDSSYRVLTHAVLEPGAAYPGASFDASGNDLLFGFTSRTYDADRLLTREYYNYQSHELPMRVTTDFAYEKGRLKTKIYDNSTYNTVTTSTFAYYDSGNPASATYVNVPHGGGSEEVSSREWVYADQGRLSEIIQTEGGQSEWIERYTY